MVGRPTDRRNGFRLPKKEEKPWGKSKFFKIYVSFSNQGEKII